MDAALEQFLKFDRKSIIDVRAPLEFTKGHLPGARSLPLFDDGERHEIGLCFAKRGQEAAVRLGLELIGPKLGGLVDRAREYAPSGEIGVYCWRGGMRSASMAWLIETAGLKVIRLSGGYKSYRAALHAFFERPLPLMVLSGPTGTDKTGILASLAARGEQMIDLEAIARHKGSSFGSIGQGLQPENEQFQNEVFEAFLKLEEQRLIWIEDESHSIGKVRLPDGLYAAMQQAPWIWVDRPFEQRVELLVGSYGNEAKDELKMGIERIRRRLGGMECDRALEYLESGQLAECAALLLRYYDKAYRFSTEKKNKDLRRVHRSASISTDEIAAELIELLRTA